MKSKIAILLSALFFTLIACNQQNDKPPKMDKLSKDNPFANEFDTPFGVPPFDKIEPKHFMPAFEEGMKQQKQEIEAIVNSKESPTFKNTVEPYMYSGELLRKVSSVFYGLMSANTNDKLQQIAEEISPILSAHRDEINLNPVLFKRIMKVYENRSSYNLTNEQSFLLEKIYKGFIRSGANLNDTDKEKLKDINKQLSVLSVKFSQNLLEETNRFKLVIENEEDLAGLPESVKDAAAEAAKKENLENKWVFTTQKPSMIPFLQYAEKRDLRKKLYHAYTHRCDNNNEHDNKDVLAKMVELRAEKANLLGYDNHAAYRLEPRMAQTPGKAIDLLNQLWDKALPVAKMEAEELQNIIDSEGGDFKLASWDWWYYAEKLRKDKYNLDENELRPYFKLANVRDGAFQVANKLYGITFKEIKDIPLPHPDATAFEVSEENGNHLGILYMDFFPRESKRVGAWCGSYRDHMIKDGKEITPVVTVVGNFTKPTSEQPSLLSMDEVLTLFHEFGHALDGLFAQNTYPKTFIAWDFVELPSQIMEHWAFEPEVLKMYATHYETGDPIPEALIEKIEKSGYFNQGFATVEYLAAAMLDMAYHTIDKPKRVNINKFESAYLNEIGLIPEIVSRYRSTYFAHIAGGYDAGYYSYIWAGVLDNDAFEAFKKKGIFDKETAKSFRKNILAKNGIKDAMTMYVDFRGREPEIEPLLKNRGLLQ